MQTTTKKVKESIGRDCSVKDTFLFTVVERFFNDENNWTQMMAVLHKPKRDGVSLRLLDYLCTVFAAKETCMVKMTDGTNAPLLDVYETSLDAYGKSHYDCFRRTSRIDIVKHGQRLSTTLGQLLFFKDIVQNGILKFARDNVTRIKEAMGSGTKSRKRGRAIAPRLVPLDSLEPVFQ